MKRSTYSLVLMDDVVAAVDRLAAQKGTSRSNLINQILAEHVCCTTPEQQMRQVFACLMEQMDAPFRIPAQGSDAMLSIFGSVQYKYRPTIRYRVELSRNLGQEPAGWLKISCRTQSQTLLDAMQTFFRFWAGLEQTSDPEGACGQGYYEILPGKMVLGLLRRGIPSEEAFGTAVGDYIRMFHSVLQSYFYGLQQEIPGAILQHTLEQQYAALRQQGL